MSENEFTVLLIQYSTPWKTQELTLPKQTPASAEICYTISFSYPVFLIQC